MLLLLIVLFSGIATNIVVAPGSGQPGAQDLPYGDLATFSPTIISDNPLTIIPCQRGEL